MVCSIIPIPSPQLEEEQEEAKQLRRAIEVHKITHCLQSKASIYLFPSQVIAEKENIHTEELKKELQATKEKNKELIVRAVVTNANRAISLHFHLGGP